MAQEHSIPTGSTPQEPLTFPVWDKTDPVERQNMLSPQELIEQTYQFMQSFRDEIPDAVFFTLKSAAPVARMMKKLWHEFYPDKKIPQIRFVDIGRTKPSEIQRDFDFHTGQIQITYVPPEIDGASTEAIRHQFANNIDTKGNIWIVDEWSESGNTLQEAGERLATAFPEASISTHVAYTKMPHWYNKPAYLRLTDATIHDQEARALHIVNQLAFERYLQEHGTDPEKEEWNQHKGKWREEYQKWFEGQNTDQDEFSGGYKEESDLMRNPQDRHVYNELLAQRADSPYAGVMYPQEDSDAFAQTTYQDATQELNTICQAVTARLKATEAK